MAFTPAFSARSASAGAFMQEWSQPRRIFSVAGRVVDETAAVINCSARSRSRISAEPDNPKHERQLSPAGKKDATALGVQKPDFEPRATGYIDDMQAMIAKLEAHGLAYKASDGDVNFSVRRFPGYGKLSGKSLDELNAGERVAVLDDRDSRNRLADFLADLRRV